MVASVVSLLVFGLKLGIDFTGGSLLEVRYEGISRPSLSSVQEAVRELNVGPFEVQPIGDTNMLVKLKSLDESTHGKLLETLRKNVTSGKLFEERFESVGPSIGQELQHKTVWAILLALVMISLYIAFAFRKVDRPVSSWKYGIAALIALFHDVIIPIGAFALLGHFHTLDIGTPFVAALLTVLGFSVHDTIVVFDRIRENLKKLGGGEPFENLVEKSLRQTIGRSINTSVTVMVVMLALYFFGGLATKFFALTILIGVFFGTYSSIFIASFLLVTWHKWSLKRA